MRERFNRTYAARKKAGHVIPIGRGVWLSLYTPESQSPVHLVGAGAGLKHPAFAEVPLDPATLISNDDEVAEEADVGESPLTIAEAKRRLAHSLGVDPSSIKIIVEG
jgi:hypothetical protein